MVSIAYLISPPVAATDRATIRALERLDLLGRERALIYKTLVLTGLRKGELASLTVAHLCLDDAERIIRDAKPKLAILTHFGMTVWRAHPWELAADLTQRTGIEVKAARDGMSLEV